MSRNFSAQDATMDLDLDRIAKLAGLEDKKVSELKELAKEKKVKVRPSKGRKHVVKQDLIDALQKGEDGAEDDEPSEELPADEPTTEETVYFEVTRKPYTYPLTMKRRAPTREEAKAQILKEFPDATIMGPDGQPEKGEAEEDGAAEDEALERRKQMKPVPHPDEPEKKAPSGPRDAFLKSIQGLKRLQGQPPLKTNAHLNRVQAGRVADAAIKAGLKAPEIIDALAKEFPRVFKKDSNGKLSQKYDSFWEIDDEQGPFALKETKVTITKKAADALITKLKKQALQKPPQGVSESTDPGQAVTENPPKQELRDPKAKVKQIKKAVRQKAVRQKWAKHGITDPKEQKAWKEVLAQFPDKRYMAEIAGKLKAKGGDGATPEDLKLLSGNDPWRVVDTLKKLGIKIKPKAVDPADIPPAKTEPPGSAESNPFKPWFKGENPAVDILIRHGNKYLVIRRGRDVNADGSVTHGALAWPGGFIDPDTGNTGVKGSAENPPPHPITQGKGEDPLDAAWRELEEETGLKKEDFAALGIDPKPLGHFGQDRKWDQRISPTDPSDSWVTSRPFVIDLPDDFELPIEAALSKGYDDASWKGWVNEEDLEKQIMFAGHHGLLSKARQSREGTLIDLDRVRSLGGSNGETPKEVAGRLASGPGGVHVLPRSADCDGPHGSGSGHGPTGSAGLSGSSLGILRSEIRDLGLGAGHHVAGTGALAAYSMSDLAFDQANMAQIKDTGFPQVMGSSPDLDAEDSWSPDEGLLDNGEKKADGPCKPGKGCSNTFKVFSSETGYNKALAHGYRDAKGEERQCHNCAWFENDGRGGRCHMFDFTALNFATCDEWEERRGDEIKGKFAADQLPGGLADKRTPEEFDPEALKKGVEIELEHVDDPDLAREIAMDHLAEHADYYDILPKVEKQMGKGATITLDLDRIAGLADKTVAELDSMLKKQGKSPKPSGGRTHLVKQDYVDALQGGQGEAPEEEKSVLVHKGPKDDSSIIDTLFGEEAKKADPEALKQKVEAAKGDPGAMQQALKSPEAKAASAATFAKAAASGVMQPLTNLIGNVASGYWKSMNRAPVKTLSGTLLTAAGMAVGGLGLSLGGPLAGAIALGITVPIWAPALSDIKDEMGMERYTFWDWFRSREQRAKAKQRAAEKKRQEEEEWHAEQRRIMQSVDSLADRLSIRSITAAAQIPDHVVGYIEARLKFSAMAEKAGKLDQFESALEKASAMSLASGKSMQPAEVVRHAYQMV